MKDPAAIEIPRRSCGLIIIDMQEEGCHKHGPTVLPIIQNIQSLLTRFREAGARVIHVQSVRTRQHPEFTVFGRKASLLADGPGVRFVEELQPLPNEPIVQKSSHDCFYGTRMEAVLNALDVQPCRDRVIVTGIGSSVCVYHAVIGFSIRNFFTIVPEDCIHAIRPEGQGFALSQFRSSAYNFNVTVARSEVITLL
jgi:nicotinamidase-related amidase